MHSNILFSAAVFSAYAFAQGDHLNIDDAEVARVEADLEAYKSSLKANPAFQTDAAKLYAALPPDVSAEAKKNPNAVAEQIIGAATPAAWEATIPTDIVEPLEEFAAKPIKAAEDVVEYITSLVAEPEVKSVLSVLQTAVPSSVQEALSSNSIAFVENLVTASAPPDWLTKLPESIQSDIGSVINHGLSIIAADFEAGGSVTVPAATAPAAAAATAATAAGAGTAMTAAAPQPPAPIATGAPIQQASDGQVQAAPSVVPISALFPSAPSAPGGESACPTCSPICPAVPTTTLTQTVTVTAVPAKPPPPGSAPPPGTAPPGTGASQGTMPAPPSSNPPFPTGGVPSTGVPGAPKPPTPTSGGAPPTGSPISSFTGAAAPVRTGAMGVAAIMVGAGVWLNM
ncbi:hypothetical protein MMC21_004403 [Puttea exsequens]|nr:hypothetical protein [Puttea exsequens]